MDPGIGGTGTTEPRGLSFVRFGTPDARGRRALRTYFVPLDRDGTRIDAPEGPDHDPLVADHVLVYDTSFDAHDHLRVHRRNTSANNAPSSWFVMVDASRQHGEGMVSIVAFDTDHFPDGTIIDEMEFVMVDVVNERQTGALIWSRLDGLISQIYVAPEHRRSEIGRYILVAASALHHSHDWPGLIHADGRRTTLGQAFVSTYSMAHRAARHSELSPPMDPA